MANKFFNKRSAVVIDGLPKLPTPDSIEYGEIAINYADGVETISIKNSANEIVEFKTKEYFEQIIEENEKLVAKALNDVDERIIELTPRVDDLFLTVDALPIVTDRDGSKFLGDDGVYHTIELNGGIVEELNEFKQNVEESEKVIAKILNDVDERCYSIEDNVNSISRDVDDLKAIVEEGQAVTAASIYQMNERCYSIEDNVNSISRDVDDLKIIVEEGGASDDYLKAILNEENGAKVIQENVPIIFPQGLMVGPIAEDASIGGEYYFDFDHSFVMTEDKKPAWRYRVTEGQLTEEISLKGHTHTEYALESNVPTKDEFTALHENVSENAEVTAAALIDLNSRFDNIGQHTVIQNLTTTISTLQQTIAELQTEITNIKNELNKTLTVE